MELKMEMKNSIERALGRKVLADEKGNVDSFADFSDLDKEEFRTLQETNLTMEISYIRYRLKRDVHISDAISYASSVIHQGMDVKKWEKSHFKSE